VLFNSWERRRGYGGLGESRPKAAIRIVTFEGAMGRFEIEDTGLDDEESWKDLRAFFNTNRGALGTGLAFS
jgi:hypothetical protein